MIPAGCCLIKIWFSVSDQYNAQSVRSSIGSNHESSHHNRSINRSSSRSPEDYNVLVTEPPLNPKHNTEKMAQVLFEKFEVPNFYSSNQGLLSCYASGRVSALMLEIGDSVSHIVPVYEGCCPQHAIRRFDFGGKDLTLYLQSLLNNQGYNFVTTADFEIVREIKELMCFASENYEQDIFKADCYGSLFKPYTLPDGNEIILNKERFQCPEQLFSSSPDIGFEGIHKMVFDSISSMDMDMRRDCNVNLIVSGGTTMLPGFPERLKREMGSLFSTSLVKVVAPPERKYSVWIGGSILASLSTFQNMWVSRQDYEEYGPDIVNRKCY